MNPPSTTPASLLTASAPDAVARRAAMLRKLSRTPTESAAASGSAGVSTAAQPAAQRRLPRWALALLGLQALALAALAWQGGWLGHVGDLPVIPPAQAKSTAQAAPAQPLPAADDAALPVAKLEASGFVTATRMATVSVRTMGQVTEVLVDEGSRVKRGQVLARLGDTAASTEWKLAQAQQQSSLARVQSAEAQLRQALRDQDRERLLRDQQFTSDASLSKVQTVVETAQAALASARADAALAALQVQRQAQAVDDHVVRAPFDGVVLARNAQVGEIVAPGGAGGGYTRTGICTIVDMKSLEIVVDVNEEMITRVQPGQAVQAELYSHKGWRLQGEVLRVMPNADRAKATVRARIKLLTEDPRILPDMAVKVFFL
jgi:HlyD family secretion protein